MTAALLCRFPLGGVILGDVHEPEDQWKASLVDGSSSYTLMAADLDGMAQWRLGVRRAKMNSRRRRTLSGVMVASMAERPGKIDALVSDLKTGQWKMAATTHESATGRFAPQTLYVARLGPPALDVRLWCDVRLVLDSYYRHTFIKWIEVATDVTRWWLHTT